MHLRRASGIAMATAALSVALLTGCSKSDTSDGSATTTTAAGPLPAIPTVADLNTWLQRGLDLNVPDSAKVEYVQGSQADPALFGKLAKIYKDQGVQIKIDSVRYNGGDQLFADGVATIYGEQHPQEVPFIAEGGHWKVTTKYACSIVQLAQVSSPACPDS